MAINPAASYPTQVDSPSGAYPYGKARNVSAPGAGDGTPWVAPVVNDLWGFMQALLYAAAITPSGDPDEVGASQYLTAMNQLFNQSAAASLIAPGLVQLSNDTSSASNALAATIGALNALRTAAATGATTSAPGIVQLSENPVSTSSTQAATINALNLLRASGSATTAGNDVAFCLKFGKIKLQGGKYTIAANTTDVRGFTPNSPVQSDYTSAFVACIPWVIGSYATGLDPVQSSVASLSQYNVVNRNAFSITYGYLCIGWDA